MNRNYLKIIIFTIIILLSSTLLQSQMIVKVEKENPDQLNLLESLNLNLVFETSNHIVLSMKNTSILTNNNIDFIVLSTNLQKEPLYFIASHRRVPLSRASYIGEIVYETDSIRLEKSNNIESKAVQLLVNIGVSAVPVEVNPYKVYQNFIY